VPAASIEELLAEIVARPDEEDARRRYADAIAATDPPRAELIQLQLAIRDVRRAGGTPPLHQYDRERALVAAHGRAWAGRAGELVWRYQFMRGFVEHVTLTAADFLARAAELFRAAPVRHVTLSAARPQIARLAASPHLVRVKSLDLSENKLGDDGVRALVESPHLKNLRYLRLAKNDLGRDAAEAVVAAPALAGLAHLDFRGNKVDLTPRPAPIKDGAVEIPMLAHDLMSRHGRRRYLESLVIPRLDEL
jgi:uncharacterized protein (TIGR02996 family)